MNLTPTISRTGSPSVELLAGFDRLRGALGEGNAEAAELSEFGRMLRKYVDRAEFRIARATKDRELSIRMLDQTLEGLQQRSDELEVNQQHLAQVISGLQLANEDMMHFMHVASHDLKTPLRSIGSFANLIQRRYGDQLGAEVSEYFEYIKRNATNMNSVIDDLVAYNQAGKTLQTEMVDLAGLLEEVALALYADLSEAGAALDTTGAALGSIMAPRASLRQLLQNLLRNAIVYRELDRPCRMRVWVECSDQNPGSTHTLCVGDNGTGLDEAFRDKVFKPFQRVGDLSRPGTGMGLAIVRRIARQMGGDIDYLGCPGVGTTFYVGLSGAPRLPAAYQSPW